MRSPFIVIRPNKLLLLQVTFLMMPLEIGWAATVMWTAGDVLCRTDILFLKHDSSIFRQSTYVVCGFPMIEQVRLCAVWPMENWLYLLQGWKSVWICYWHMHDDIQTVIQPCKWFSVGQTATSLTCSIMETPHTGLDDCLRMLQACFRKRMSGFRMPLENLQSARALHEPTFLTAMSLELHVTTRQRLRDQLNKKWSSRKTDSL